MTELASRDHRLLLVTTGGTISGHFASGGQERDGVLKSSDLLTLIAPSVSAIGRRYDLKIDSSVCALCDVDSSNITPEHWTSIARLIAARYDQYDSFVVTHGTNTLGYTCAALSFALANPAKPVVVTGSQITAGLPGSDGLITNPAGKWFTFSGPQDT